MFKFEIFVDDQLRVFHMRVHGDHTEKFFIYFTSLRKSIFSTETSSEQNFKLMMQIKLKLLEETFL